MPTHLGTLFAFDASAQCAAEREIIINQRNRGERRKIPIVRE